MLTYRNTEITTIDFAAFCALAHRYHDITNDMRTALPLIANGQRDTAQDILGEYGYQWEIIETFLVDLHDSGIRVSAVDR